MDDPEKAPTSRTNAEVRHFLEEQVMWQKNSEACYPYIAIVEGEKCLLRLNDFPDEHLYTLIVSGEEIVDFDDWPEQWTRV